jgi:uncharacterized delta-60 repeat protein
MRATLLAILLSAIGHAAMAAGWGPDPGFVGSDPTSGGAGRAAISFFGDIAPTEMAVGLLRDDNDRLLAIGQTRSASPFFKVDIAIARLLPSGADDAGFGTGGRVVVAGAGMDEVVKAAFDSQGRIVVLGNCETCGSSGDGEAVLVRLLPSGAMDPAFGGGRVAFNLRGEHTGGDDIAQTLAVLPNDDLLVGGAELTNISIPHGRRISAAGIPGATPNVVGFGNTTVPSVLDILVQGDKSVWLVGGPTQASQNAPIATLMRFNDDLSLDTTFGSNGTFFLRAGYFSGAEQGCGLEQPYLPVALVRFRGTYKVIGNRSSPPFGLFYASVSATAPTTTTFRCLSAAADPEFIVRAALTTPGDLSGSIALAGDCDFNPCVWRVRKPVGNIGDAVIEADTGFSAQPLAVKFPSDAAIVPSGAAMALTTDLTTAVMIAGTRRWNLSGARDFAVARLEDLDLFRNGFE